MVISELIGIRTKKGNYKFVCMCGKVIRIYPMKYYELPSFVVCTNCNEVFYLNYLG
jgi:hypothetical protein